MHQGRVVWGFGLHNGWWGGYGSRVNITRRWPGYVGPGQTEDLELLTDAMVEFGFPGLEHNFGLWYDRRRDEHDTARRLDDRAAPPFLEQPWSRSDIGVAWDGLPKYDLERFNDWYFQRLRRFAEIGETKGTILLFNFYMQHALLENPAHYVDFPWRPANAMQDTEMPDGIPAANVFYDVSNETRRHLHRIYIEKSLDQLGEFSNVVFLLSQEYTGPVEFVEFWMDTIREWEEKTGRRVKIGLGATKDVMDAVLSDPERGSRVSVLDLRYWWIRPDGSFHAPRGGQEIAGRYAGGHESAKTLPNRIYEQVMNYRAAYPTRAILHSIYSDAAQTWAFLMAGGSLLVRPLDYPILSEDEPAPEPPVEYPAPWEWQIIEPMHRLVTGPFADLLPSMIPCPDRVSDPLSNWCLAKGQEVFLIYNQAGTPLKVDLSDASAPLNGSWIDPQTGLPRGEAEPIAQEDSVISFEPPSARDWILWLH